MEDTSKPNRRQRIRIAQLSDLHCDGSEAWLRNFQAVGELLHSARPDLILITGDCANHPRKKFYEQLRRELESLLHRLESQTGKRPPICVIPGNHDYSFFGNQLLGLLQRNPFRDGLGAFNGTSEGVRGDLGQFAQEHGIIIYPFDSNLSKLGRVSFARGRVDDPGKRFQQLATEYRNLLHASGRRWDDCLHIAILHHHPLPLPDTIQAQQLEQFHILDNAAEFLSAASEAGVHLILHGHKHVSGMAEYRYTGLKDNTQSVCVSACGTSSKVGANEREVCFFDVLRSGSVAIRRVRANTAGPWFHFDESDPAREVIRYAYRRKRRASARENWDLENTAVRAIRTKTKTVRVLGNGRGYVKITLDGIEWNRNAHPSECVFREYLHGGIGRVAGGWSSYLDSKGHLLSQFHRLDLEVPAQRADSFEGVWFDLPKIDSPDLPSRFELRYVLQGGYFLSERDFAEALHLPRGQNAEQTSTIEALIQTEALELTVNFPDKSLPREDQVSIDAWLLYDGQPREDISIALRTYELDEDETNFLRAHGAVRYRPELNQISVIVRHPQPSVAYTLRWVLPNTPPAHTRRTEAHLRFRDRLRQLCTAEQAAIEQGIRAGLDRNDVRVSLFVYEPPEEAGDIGRLTLLPRGQKSSRSALVGRGIIGEAFRSRRLQYHSQHPVSGHQRGFTDTQDLASESPTEILWVDAVLSEPIEPGATELLVIPILGPSLQARGLENQETSDLPVVGVLLIARYGRENEDPSNNFFAFDLDTPDGQRNAQEMAQPMLGIVESVLS